MQVSCEPFENDIIFRINEFDPLYEPVLQSCFYQKDDIGYYKRYSATVRYIDKIQKRFLKYAPVMLAQLAYQIEVPWQDALEAFCQRTAGSGIRWWLTGSCAACLRGIALNPHDVDIMIDSRDCDIVADLFADELIEPILDTQGWVTKDFGVIFLKGRIDIASDPHPCLDEPQPVDCGPYALAHLETINWRGFTIKIPPVHLQLNANLRRNRLDRVKLIKQYMAVNKEG